MPQPHRLFDCLDQLMKTAPDAPVLRGKENGEWRAYTTREVRDIVDRLSAGLISLGIGWADGSVEGRGKVAILSKNRPEWVLLDLAVQQIGGVLIPIYPTAHVNDISFVLRDAGVKVVVVNDEDLFHKVQSVRSETPLVEHIFSFEPVEGAQHWKELAGLGRPEHAIGMEEIRARINTEDLFTIIYTSGTTGTPKGVMLSHHNVLSNVMATIPHFPLQPGTRVISFLPLNHIFERMVTYVYLFAGATISFAESLETLGDNIREVRPQMFTTVPRLLEKVYEKILAKGEAQTGIKKKLFFWALRLAERYDPQKPGSPGYRAQLALANRIVFSKWREGLGGAVDCICTGAAACQVRLIRIFTAAGIPILEGYGQTESSPVISFNRMEGDGTRFGTVGLVIDGVEVRIAEDGEILCKGPNVMMGYYKRPDLTADTVHDGWLHTGDIGRMEEGRFLKITDRKKEIFKTSGGKYVAPQPIENKMAESPFIEQIMVLGADQKFVSALIVPSLHAVQEWAREHGAEVPADRSAAAAHPKVRERIKEEVERFNRHFNPVEQVKKIGLLPSEWTVDGGELTPTLKLKRKVIMEKYAARISELYG